MKRFDPAAIKERGLKNLQTYDKWKNLQKDGAAEQFYEALSEPLAENARYGEYLLGELKWDTCRNYSSAKQMAKLVGKKLNRKHSAIGTIIVSHSDPEGNKRYANLGSENYDIDRESDYDSGKLDTSLTEEFYKKSLVPYIASKTYSVPIGATFNTSKGIPFTAAEEKSIQPWSQDWNEIESSATKRDSFISKGGWSNFKYILVPVVQGEVAEVVLGVSDGTAGQTFTVATLDIEAADSYYTKQFCYLVEQKEDGSEEIWEEMYHLGNARCTDHYFEINILDDLSGTIIKFGDGINGAIPSENSVLTLHFLKTLGANGNVYDSFSFQNEINGVDLPTDIPFTDFSIGCQNPWPILGGSDFETFKEFKKNSETAYENNYEVLHTYPELEDKINCISPIPLIKIKTSEFYKEFYVNSTKIIKPCIGISGLSTSMEPLSTIESSIFENVINTQLNNKILSNKNIEYKKPNIVKIQSAISLELKTSVTSKEDFSNNMQTNLLAQLGKSNTNTIDQYMQSEIIKRSLDYSEKIGSIDSTDLLSISPTNVDLVTNDGVNFYVVVSFESPELNINMLGTDGYCNKSATDGYGIPYVFNLLLGDQSFTVVVSEDKDASENWRLMYQSTMSDKTYKAYKLSDNMKFRSYELVRSQRTFSKLNLQSVDNLVTNSNATFNDEQIKFYMERYPNKISGNFFIPVEIIGPYVGFKNVESEDKANLAQKIYNQVKSSLDNNLIAFDFYFIPTDKTIGSSWNTIFYYDNITVEVDG